MNIFDLFHHTDDKGNILAVHGTGALDRPEHYGKLESPSHSEISGAMAPAVWVEKDPTTGFTTYPKRNQGVKSDCTCYTASKLLSIDYLQATGVWRELAPDTVYPYVCQPGGGANSITVMDFTVTKGIGVDALYPCDALTEQQAESSASIPADEKIIAMLYRPGQIVQCATDFETIASILYAYQQQGIKKGVGITLIGKNNGSWYNNSPIPPQSVTDPADWYHKVTVTDFGLVNGGKVLAIDNSWGTVPGNKGQQFLTQAYEPFIYGGLYTLPPLNPNVINPPAKPSYQWTGVLQVGSTGPDVVALQQALQSLGMFPVSDLVSATGNYFGITKQAVETYQAAFGLPVTGIVDIATIASLNNIFK